MTTINAISTDETSCDLFSGDALAAEDFFPDDIIPIAFNLLAILLVLFLSIPPPSSLFAAPSFLVTINHLL